MGTILNMVYYGTSGGIAKTVMWLSSALAERQKLRPARGKAVTLGFRRAR